MRKTERYPVLKTQHVLRLHCTNVYRVYLCLSEPAFLCMSIKYSKKERRKKHWVFNSEERTPSGGFSYTLNAWSAIHNL